MADDRERLNDVGSTKWHFTLAWLPKVCFASGFVLVGGLTGFGTDGTGGVCGDRQEADVIDHHDVCSQEVGDGLGHGVVGTMSAQRHAEVFQGERWTHSRVRNACWVGAGIEETSGCQGAEGCA